MKNKTSTKMNKDRMDEALLEMATALYDIGEMDAVTMRKFEAIKAPKVKELQSKEIKQGKPGYVRGIAPVFLF